jgi:hypothetical protein
MDDFRLSFFLFFALATLLPWALGFVLWRKLCRREKAVHVTVASMAALAFVIGAVWWTAIHPAIWPNPPAEVPNPNPPPIWGLAILAGVAGVICLTIATVVLAAIIGIWDRARPGTFARLLARLREEAKGAAASPRTPDS